MKTRLLQSGLLIAGIFASGTPASAFIDNEAAKYLPTDGATNDLFGISASTSGSVVIVGAPWDDDNGTDSGSAYLFDSTTGNQIAKLLPSDGKTNDEFGWSVGLSGDLAVVGAPTDDEPFSASGSAYLFDVTTGAQLAQLIASDASVSDRFGYSVAISGNYVVVGAFASYGIGLQFSGCAYVFDVSVPTAPIEIAVLLPNDPDFIDQFGRSVAISGTTVIVGSPRDDDHGSSSGSAYIFDALTGAQLWKVNALDGASFDYFGNTVAIHDGIAVIGAYDDDDNGHNSGSAYVYDVNTGVQLAKLLPDDGVTGDKFGIRVGIHGGTVIVGANYDDDNGAESGSAYLFDAGTGTQLDKLLPSDGAADDRFGCAVAISDSQIIVAAHNDDDNVADSGSAYRFEYSRSPGLSYCFGDGSGASCPCGNTGAQDSGCGNGVGTGAVLGATGSDSVSADNLVLSATGLPSGPGLFFQGENAVNGGSGVTFGDGLRCAGGGIKRLEVLISSSGSVSTTVSVATMGVVSSGDTRRYQYWYRDTPGSPCGGNFNLSNGYEVLWTP